MQILDASLVAKGTNLLRIFHSTWRTFPAAKGMSFDVFLATVKARRPMGGDAFLEGLGLTSEQVSGTTAAAIIREFAMQSQGRLPAKNSDFITALTKKGVVFSWVDAIAFTAIESGKDLLDGAQQVGDSVLTAAKIINLLLPLFIVGYALYLFNNATGGSVAKGAKAVFK